MFETSAVNNFGNGIMYMNNKTVAST